MQIPYSQGSNMKFSLVIFSMFLALYSTAPKATLITSELEPAQKAFKESNDLCSGIVNTVRPLADREDPEALIAFGDIYRACVKDDETKKFETLFFLYAKGATRDSISNSISDKKTHARRWGYQRLWDLMYYAQDIKNFNPLDYIREMHILAAAALFHGGQDMCWRAGGVWLESKYGCETIGQLANDYIYPVGEDGWKSPLPNKPLNGVMLQIHRANESNLDEEEVKWVFEFAKTALSQNVKINGKVVCLSKDNFSGGIIALRQNLSQSPFFGHCIYKDWNSVGNKVTAKSFNDYGLVVEFSDGSGWGLIDLERLPRMAADAAKDLKADISIEEMDEFVRNLYKKIFNK